jgi:hypothetical protein
MLAAPAAPSPAAPAVQRPAVPPGRGPLVQALTGLAAHTSSDKDKRRGTTQQSPPERQPALFACLQGILLLWFHVLTDVEILHVCLGAGTHAMCCTACCSASESALLQVLFAAAQAMTGCSLSRLLPSDISSVPAAGRALEVHAG